MQKPRYTPCTGECVHKCIENHFNYGQTKRHQSGGKKTRYKFSQNHHQMERVTSRPPHAGDDGADKRNVFKAMFARRNSRTGGERCPGCPCGVGGLRRSQCHGNGRPPLKIPPLFDLSRNFFRESDSKVTDLSNVPFGTLLGNLFGRIIATTKVNSRGNVFNVNSDDILGQLRDNREADAYFARYLDDCADKMSSVYTEGEKRQMEYVMQVNIKDKKEEEEIAKKNRVKVERSRLGRSLVALDNKEKSPGYESRVLGRCRKEFVESDARRKMVVEKFDVATDHMVPTRDTNDGVVPQGCSNRAGRREVDTLYAGERRCDGGVVNCPWGKGRDSLLRERVKSDLILKIKEENERMLRALKSRPAIVGTNANVRRVSFNDHVEVQFDRGVVRENCRATKDGRTTSTPPPRTKDVNVSSFDEEMQRVLRRVKLEKAKEQLRQFATSVNSLRRIAPTMESECPHAIRREASKAVTRVRRRDARVVVSVQDLRRKSKEPEKRKDMFVRKRSSPIEPERSDVFVRTRNSLTEPERRNNVLVRNRDIVMEPEKLNDVSVRKRDTSIEPERINDVFVRKRDTPIEPERINDVSVRTRDTSKEPQRRNDVFVLKRDTPIESERRNDVFVRKRDTSIEPERINDVFVRKRDTPIEPERRNDVSVRTRDTSKEPQRRNDVFVLKRDTPIEPERINDVFVLKRDIPIEPERINDVFVRKRDTPIEPERINDVSVRTRDTSKEPQGRNDVFVPKRDTPIESERGNDVYVRKRETSPKRKVEPSKDLTAHVCAMSSEERGRVCQNSVNACREKDLNFVRDKNKYTVDNEGGNVGARLFEVRRSKPDDNGDVIKNNRNFGGGCRPREIDKRRDGRRLGFMRREYVSNRARKNGTRRNVEDLRPIKEELSGSGTQRESYHKFPGNPSMSLERAPVEEGIVKGVNRRETFSCDSYRETSVADCHGQKVMMVEEEPYLVEFFDLNEFWRQVSKLQEVEEKRRKKSKSSPRSVVESVEERRAIKDCLRKIMAMKTGERNKRLKWRGSTHRCVGKGIRQTAATSVAKRRQSGEFQEMLHDVKTKIKMWSRVVASRSDCLTSSSQESMDEVEGSSPDGCEQIEFEDERRDGGGVLRCHGTKVVVAAERELRSFPQETKVCSNAREEATRVETKTSNLSEYQEMMEGVKSKIDMWGAVRSSMEMNRSERRIEQLSPATDETTTIFPKPNAPVRITFREKGCCDDVTVSEDTTPNSDEVIDINADIGPKCVACEIPKPLATKSNVKDVCVRRSLRLQGRISDEELVQNDVNASKKHSHQGKSNACESTEKGSKKQYVNDKIRDVVKNVVSDRNNQALVLKCGAKGDNGKSPSVRRKTSGSHIPVLHKNRKVVVVDEGGVDVLKGVVLEGSEASLQSTTPENRRSECQPSGEEKLAVRPSARRKEGIVEEGGVTLKAVDQFESSESCGDDKMSTTQRAPKVAKKLRVCKLLNRNGKRSRKGSAFRSSVPSLGNIKFLANLNEVDVKKSDKDVTATRSPSSETSRMEKSAKGYAASGESCRKDFRGPGGSTMSKTNTLLNEGSKGGQSTCCSAKKTELRDTTSPFISNRDRRTTTDRDRDRRSSLTCTKCHTEEYIPRANSKSNVSVEKVDVVAPSVRAEDGKREAERGNSIVRNSVTETNRERNSVAEKRPVVATKHVDVDETRQRKCRRATSNDKDTIDDHVNVVAETNSNAKILLYVSRSTTAVNPRRRQFLSDSELLAKYFVTEDGTRVKAETAGSTRTRIRQYVAERLELAPLPYKEPSRPKTKVHEEGARAATESAKNAKSEVGSTTDSSLIAKEVTAERGNWNEKTDLRNSDNAESKNEKSKKGNETIIVDSNEKNALNDDVTTPCTTMCSREDAHVNLNKYQSLRSRTDEDTATQVLQEYQKTGQTVDDLLARVDEVIQDRFLTLATVNGITIVVTDRLFVNDASFQTQRGIVGKIAGENSDGVMSTVDEKGDVKTDEGTATVRKNDGRQTYRESFKDSNRYFQVTKTDECCDESVTEIVKSSRKSKIFEDRRERNSNDHNVFCVSRIKCKTTCTCCHNVKRERALRGFTRATTTRSHGAYASEKSRLAFEALVGVEATGDVDCCGDGNDVDLKMMQEVTFMNVDDAGVKAPARASWEGRPERFQSGEGKIRSHAREDQMALPTKSSTRGKTPELLPFDYYLESVRSNLKEDEMEMISELPNKNRGSQNGTYSKSDREWRTKISEGGEEDGGGELSSRSTDPSVRTIEEVIRAADDDDHYPSICQCFGVDSIANLMERLSVPDVATEKNVVEASKREGQCGGGVEIVVERTDAVVNDMDTDTWRRSKNDPSINEEAAFHWELASSEPIDQGSDESLDSRAQQPEYFTAPEYDHEIMSLNVVTKHEKRKELKRLRKERDTTCEIVRNTLTSQFVHNYAVRSGIITDTTTLSNAGDGSVVSSRWTSSCGLGARRPERVNLEIQLQELGCDSTNIFIQVSDDEEFKVNRRVYRTSTQTSTLTLWSGDEIVHVDPQEVVMNSRSRSDRPWTTREHRRFERAVKSLAPETGVWDKIAASVGRTKRECVLHFLDVMKDVIERAKRLV